MKPFLILVGIAAMGVLGFVAEPAFRFKVTGLNPKKTSGNALETLGIRPSGSAPTIDLTALTPEQLPKNVTISDELKFADEASGLSITLAPGSRSKLLRIEGANAVIRPGDTAYSIVLPISKTNLMEQLAAKPPATTPPPAPKPTPAPGGDSEEPAPVPATVVDPQPAPVPAPVPEPAPAPEPAPIPEPAPVPTAPAAGPVDVVKVMQESIRSGQIKEFTFDQVLGWKAAADETVNGVEFQTGTAAYKAETILGVNELQAKAFIKDGKVQRWIWPKTSMEIK